MENKLFYSPEETSKILGICTTYVYREISLGNLERLKYGRRTLIPAASINSWTPTSQEEVEV